MEKKIPVRSMKPQIKFIIIKHLMVNLLEPRKNMLKIFPYYVIIIKNGEERRMKMMIDLKILALIVVMIAVVVLVIYLVRLLKKMMITLEHANKILEDVEVVSEIAANRSKDLDGIIGNVSESAAEISAAVKGNKNVVAAAASVVKAAAAVKKAVEKDKKEKKEK